MCSARRELAYGRARLMAVFGGWRICRWESQSFRLRCGPVPPMDAACHEGRGWVYASTQVQIPNRIEQCGRPTSAHESDGKSAQRVRAWICTDPHWTSATMPIGSGMSFNRTCFGHPMFRELMSSQSRSPVEVGPVVRKPWPRLPQPLLPHVYSWAWVLSLRYSHCQRAPSA